MPRPEPVQSRHEQEGMRGAGGSQSDRGTTSNLRDFAVCTTTGGVSGRRYGGESRFAATFQGGDDLLPFGLPPCPRAPATVGRAKDLLDATAPSPHGLGRSKLGG